MNALELLLARVDAGLRAFLRHLHLAPALQLTPGLFGSVTLAPRGIRLHAVVVPRLLVPVLNHALGVLPFNLFALAHGSHIIGDEAFVMIAHLGLLDVVNEASAAIDEVGEGSNTQDGQNEAFDEINDEHIRRVLSVSRK